MKIRSSWLCLWQTITNRFFVRYKLGKGRRNGKDCKNWGVAGLIFWWRGGGWLCAVFWEPGPGEHQHQPARWWRIWRITGGASFVWFTHLIFVISFSRQDVWIPNFTPKNNLKNTRTARVLVTDLTDYGRRYSSELRRRTTSQVPNPLHFEKREKKGEIEIPDKSMRQWPWDINTHSPHKQTYKITK